MSWFSPAPKHSIYSQRVMPAAETIRRIRPWAEDLGVTRLADITGLDRLGLPTYSAVVPDSRDIISVYNGKGLRRVEAQAGALMEAVERQSALRCRPPWVTDSYLNRAAAGDSLDVRRLAVRLRPDYSDDALGEWVVGHRVADGSPVMVPAGVAGYLWTDLPHPSPVGWASSNGLASGNCFEEAVAHALCELIERDAWTLAELASQWLPRALRVRALGKLGQAGPDDMERYATLDITTAPPVARAIAERFHRAGLPLRVRHITSDLGIPTFVAVTAEWVFPAFPQAHFGLGTHPNAEVALVRALVEVAQSRAVDIQAVREDIVLAGDTETQGAIHTRRAATVDTSSWLHNDSSRPVAFSAIPTHLSTDVLDDIRFMMQQLRAHGLTEVIVVDLTPTGAPFSVVRVVVPGLESWGADHGKIGERATTFWRHEQLR